MASSWDCPSRHTGTWNCPCILWGSCPRVLGPACASPVQDAPESYLVALGIGRWPGIRVDDESWAQCHNHGQVGEKMKAHCGRGQYLPVHFGAWCPVAKTKGPPDSKASPGTGRLYP